MEIVEEDIDPQLMILQSAINPAVVYELVNNEAAEPIDYFDYR